MDFHLALASASTVLTTEYKVAKQDAAVQLLKELHDIDDLTVPFCASFNVETRLMVSM